MAGKPKALKFTPARMARLADVKALVATLPGADKNNLPHFVRPGIFTVNGILDGEEQETMRIALTEDDSVPDALGSEVILNHLCQAGLIEAATWIFMD